MIESAGSSPHRHRQTSHIIKSKARSISGVRLMVVLAAVIGVANWFNQSIRANSENRLLAKSSFTSTPIGDCDIPRPIIPPIRIRKGIRSSYSDDQYSVSAVSLMQSVASLLAVGQAGLYDPSKIATYSLTGKRIMDFGCGAGRLLTALQTSGVCYQHYTGVDVGQKEIEWLKSAYPDTTKHSFVHINVHNERYNPKGQVLDAHQEGGVAGLGLDPALAGTMDLIVLRSVFSHMVASDIRNHLTALRPLLSKKGILYVSLFVRDDIAEEEVENPGVEHTPLHVVVIKKSSFEAMVFESDYHIVLYTTVMGQQTYLLAPGKQAEPSASVA